MIYAETLRHFIQEWVQITPPKKLKEWPWRKNSKLYLINLYSISCREYFDSVPSPFISILVNALEDGDEGCVPENRKIYRTHFSGPDSFTLPRKYLFVPEQAGGISFKTNRYSFTSEGSGWWYNSWDTQEMQFLKLMRKRPHQRLNIYDSDVYNRLRNRMNTIAHMNETVIRSAENLIDLTDRVQGVVPRATDDEPVFIPKDGAIMLIQAPVTGLLNPIRKSRDYKIINGALVVSSEPVMMALPEEPCKTEYHKMKFPFSGVYNYSMLGADTPSAVSKTIVYLAVEAPGCTFSFNEYMSSNGSITTPDGMNYSRVLTHAFNIMPELSGDVVETRLRQTISEGLIPNTPENARFLTKRPSEKLFYRADMPTGFVKRDGMVSTTL